MQLEPKQSNCNLQRKDRKFLRIQLLLGMWLFLEKHIFKQLIPTFQHRFSSGWKKKINEIQPIRFSAWEDWLKPGNKPSSYGEKIQKTYQANKIHGDS